MFIIEQRLIFPNHIEDIAGDAVLAQEAKAKLNEDRLSGGKVRNSPWLRLSVWPFDLQRVE